MAKSWLVFAVSFTPETPNFGTFGGVAHPPWAFKFFLKFLFFNCVYVHVSNLNYEKHLDI